YREELDGIEGLTLNREPAGTKNSFWMTTIALDDTYVMPKVHLMKLLSADGIDSRPVFYPLSSLPAFRFQGGEGQWRAENPIAYKMSEQAINLPSALALTRDDVRRVCSSLRAHLERARTPVLRVAVGGR